MVGEALEGLVAHVLQKSRVHLDLSTTPSPEEGKDVLPQSPGPYDQPKRRTDHTSHVVP